MLDAANKSYKVVRCQRVLPDQHAPVRCSFGADGYIDLTVKDFAYWHQGSIDLSQIGFFVTTSEAEAQLEVALSQVRRTLHLHTRIAGVQERCKRQRGARCRDRRERSRTQCRTHICCLDDAEMG